MEFVLSVSQLLLKLENTSDHGKEHKLYATAVPIAKLLFGDLILGYISELVACPNDTR